MADSRELDAPAIRRAFSRAAADYERAAFLQREIERRLLERVDSVKQSPRRVLDLGCGPGLGAERLKQRFRKAQLVALDHALPMAALAAGRSRWMRPIEAVCAEAQRLPLATGSVDLVFSNLMLQWVADREACFDELRRVLRPGGVLLFTTFGPDTLKELRDAWREANGNVHVHEFVDMHHVGDEMLRAGFADPVMDSETLTVTYPDARGLMRDLKAVGAHNAASQRARGLTGKAHFQRMLKAYERHRADGLLPATYEVVYGHALAPAEGQPRRTAGGQEASFSVDKLRSTIRRRDS